MDQFTGTQQTSQEGFNIDEGFIYSNSLNRSSADGGVTTQDFVGRERTNDLILTGAIGAKEGSYAKAAIQLRKNYADIEKQLVQQTRGNVGELEIGGVQIPLKKLAQAYYNRYPKAYGIPIVSVRKENGRDLLAFKLADGSVLDYAQMMQAAFDDDLQGIVTQNNREGKLILRSVPDPLDQNNLDDLPRF